MIRRRTQQQPPRYHEDGKLRDLTPIERLILSAFEPGATDNRFQDSITIAGWLNGGRCFPRSHYNAAERMATIALRDLVAMGYLQADRSGWLRLADNPPNQEATQ